MCQLDRVNLVFVDHILCEEGKRLRHAWYEARQAFQAHKETVTSKIWQDQRSQELYNAYETARVAYDRHLEETQET